MNMGDSFGLSGKGLHTVSFEDQGFKTQQYTVHSPTILGLQGRDVVEKEVQFLNTEIEDVKDALQIENLDYGEFHRKLKEYCGIFKTKTNSMSGTWADKALSQDAIHEFFGLKTVKGDSKLQTERISNLGNYIKNNIKYFLEAHFGINEKEEGPGKAVVHQAGD